jgi:hypothetical protein
MPRAGPGSTQSSSLGEPVHLLFGQPPAILTERFIIVIFMFIVEFF